MERGAERFAGMVVVPDVTGGLVRWLAGRAVDPDRTPRFQALPGPKPVLGLGRLGPAPGWAVVAEGLFDWLALTGWGIPSCAALGTQGVERIASALRGCPRVFLAFDGDDAGLEATERLLTLLGRPNESVYRLENPASISGYTEFDAPSGTRLAANTSYHVAVRSTSGSVTCQTSTNDAYNVGRASDWTTGASFGLDDQGSFNSVFNAQGCAVRIRGEAAIDTSHITDLEITSSPAVAAGYATGETLEATVTFSEAVTVDTTTPPTLKVVIGSNTRTMTYNATDSSSTELQFDYTVVAADKDGNGASFNEDALAGTITRTSDSKAADLEHAAVADDSRARVNMPPAVTVSFGSATYSVDEGAAAVVVRVTLSAAPQRNLTIPLTASFRGGATAADFATDNKTEITFESDETSTTFRYRPVDDTVADHGESVRLSFGTLPTGVTAGDTPRTTITIIDDDPAVTVEFGSATYSGAEGDAVMVTVTLSAAPQRPLTIPITTTPQDGAEAADVLVGSSVSFGTGDTEQQFSAVLADDPFADHGESLQLSFGTLPPGVTASGTTTTTITIIDNDPAVTFTFPTDAYSITEGESVLVTVTLSAAPQRPLRLPIQFGRPIGGITGADYDVPEAVIFAAEETENSFSFSAVQDTDADHGDSVRVSIGPTYPPGLSLSGNSGATITIIDDDPPPRHRRVCLNHVLGRGGQVGDRDGDAER